MLKPRNSLNVRDVLEWVLTPEEFEEKRWGFSFDPYKIHHIKCQKRPFMELEPYMSEVANNCYHLLEYLDDQSSDSRLETLIETYQKPVIIRDDIGEFTLNRAYSWFEGFITYEGGKIHAILLRVQMKVSLQVLLMI